jgi:hypothetical protein
MPRLTDRRVGEDACHLIPLLGSDSELGRRGWIFLPPVDGRQRGKTRGNSRGLERVIGDVDGLARQGTCHHTKHHNTSELMGRFQTQKICAPRDAKTSQKRGILEGRTGWKTEFGPRIIIQGDSSEKGCHFPRTEQGAVLDGLSADESVARGSDALQQRVCRTGDGEGFHRDSGCRIFGCGDGAPRGLPV